MCRRHRASAPGEHTRTMIHAFVCFAIYEPFREFELEWLMHACVFLFRFRCRQAMLGRLWLHVRHRSRLDGGLQHGSQRKQTHNASCSFCSGIGVASVSVADPPLVFLFVCCVDVARVPKLWPTPGPAVCPTWTFTFSLAMAAEPALQRRSTQRSMEWDPCRSERCGSVSTTHMHAECSGPTAPQTLGAHFSSLCCLLADIETGGQGAPSDNDAWMQQAVVQAVARIGGNRIGVYSSAYECQSNANREGNAQREQRASASMQPCAAPSAQLLLGSCFCAVCSSLNREPSDGIRRGSVFVPVVVPGLRWGSQFQLILWIRGLDFSGNEAVPGRCLRVRCGCRSFLVPVMAPGLHRLLRSAALSPLFLTLFPLCRPSIFCFAPFLSFPAPSSFLLVEVPLSSVELGILQLASCTRWSHIGLVHYQHTMGRQHVQRERAFIHQSAQVRYPARSRRARARGISKRESANTEVHD